MHLNIPFCDDIGRTAWSNEQIAVVGKANPTVVKKFINMGTQKNSVGTIEALLVGANAHGFM